MPKDDWENSQSVVNPPISKSSVQLKILVVSNQYIEWVNKINWINEVISNKLNKCFLSQIKKVRENNNFYILNKLHHSTLFFIRMIESLSHRKGKTSQNLKLDMYIQ